MSTKYILHGGYLQKASDGGKTLCEEFEKVRNGSLPLKILDCMFARPEDSWEQKIKEDKEFFCGHLTNFELTLADPEKFINQINEADIIILRGGYEDTLLSILTRTGDWTGELDGKILLGSSAGADIISKHYYSCDTMAIGHGLGILPIKFIPHYKSSYGAEGSRGPIDWEKAYKELQEYGDTTLPIYTLKEGEFKVFEDNAS